LGTTRGRRIEPSNLSRTILKPASRACGIGGWVSWHTFRHSAATDVLRQNWNAEQVALQLGHANGAFTSKVYAHFIPKDIPKPDFPALATGNWGATRGAETSRNVNEPMAAEVAVS